MKPHKWAGLKGIGRASGSQIGRIAVKLYVCGGCGLQHKGVERPDKTGKVRFGAPMQCMNADCGRMDFTCFDSTGEAGRWAQLLLLSFAGRITDLSRQVRFDLMAHRADGVGVKVGEYIADFVYQRDGERVIEDFKGAITDIASWKLRHMAAQGMPVAIVTSKGKHNGR